MSRLAIQGGTPVRSRPWPNWPVHDEREEAAVLAVIRGGGWGGFPMPAPHAARFATSFAQRHDCAFGQCVANGTVAIEIGLEALAIEPGAEVIVPAYTFEGTAAAILFAGCVPVFVDIDPRTYCMSADAADAAITDRTQAILVVHLGMRLADMDRLTSIAESRGLAILEDCAHAHGARWRGQGVGSLGRVGAFSFQTSKLMTAGEGGLVTTNEVGIADRLYALSNCGRQRPDRTSDVAAIGHNYRMTDFQAAILEVQLTRLDAQHETRNRNMRVLEDRLHQLVGLSPLDRDERITTQAAYQFVFRYDPAAFGGLPRETFVAALRTEGVPCEGQFYEPVYNSPLFQRDTTRYQAWKQAVGRAPHCPVAWRAGYEEAIWLPHHLFLGDRHDVDDLVEAMAKVSSQADRLQGFDHPAIQAQRLSRARRAERRPGAGREDTGAAGD